MNELWQTTLWRQFGGAIDMLENALKRCPEERWTGRLWDAPGEPPAATEFWYLAYHNLFWLDLYVHGSVEGFAPPAPFNLDELDPAGLYPAQPYTPAELLAYLGYCRAKCRAAIDGLTDESTARVCNFRWGELVYAELLLYSLRHTQEHAAQLNMYLGQLEGQAARWVVRTPGDNGER